MQVTVRHWGKSGQKVKAETSEELLLAGSLSSSSFLTEPRITCLGNGAAHSGQGLPHQ